MYYFIEKYDLAPAGSRVLHLAPDRSVGFHLIDKVGKENYEAKDLCPENYHRDLGTQYFDLTKASELETERYDLILHSHVLEHIPCNIASVLWHLHRSLKHGGAHLFIIPMSPGKSESDFGDLSDEERVARFGQHNHVRRFGFDDVDMTIGSVFRLHEQSYGLRLPADVAAKHNMSVGEVKRTFFFFRKEDLTLV